MKKIGGYRLLAMSLGVLMVMVAVGTHFYLTLGYCVNECSYKFLSGYFKPLHFFAVYFAPIILFMAFMPTAVIRRWLYFICIPILLLTLYFVEDISPFASGFYLDDRSTMVQFSMYVLAAVTAVFVAVHLGINWYRTHRRNGK